MDYIPILMVFAVAAVVAGALLGIPLLIAPKRIFAIKQEPFECGKDPVMLPEGRFAIKFSTIAIFSSSSISSWSSSGRGGPVSPARVVRLHGDAVFLGILMLAFSTSGRNEGSNGSRRVLHLQA